MAELCQRPEPVEWHVEQIDRRVAVLDKEIAARAKASTACKRLMTVPGVGRLVPDLCCRRGRPGTVQRLPNRRCSLRPDPATVPVRRDGLVRRDQPCWRRRGAACAVLGSQRAHPSQPWLVRPEVLGRTAGQAPRPGQAKVALARKLAVVLHKMWTTGEDYRLAAAV